MSLIVSTKFSLNTFSPGVRLMESVNKKKGIIPLAQCVQTVWEDDNSKIRKQRKMAEGHMTIKPKKTTVLPLWYGMTIAQSHYFFTEIGHEPEGVAKRWSKVARNHAEAPMPAVVSHYNKHMGGINLLDGLLAWHRYLMKSRRWYNYLSWMLYISSWTIKRTVPHLSV